MAEYRKQRRASRWSVVISFTVHGILIGILAFFAAREGMLGKQLKKIAVEIVCKEKPPEKPPEKPKERPVETKPSEEAVKAEAPKPPPPSPPPQTTGTKPSAAPPPPATAAPSAAPPAVDVPAFDFDGGKIVDTTSDPTILYKGFVEYTLRSRWNRPEGIADAAYVAEVELSIDRDGRLLNTAWRRGSGDSIWDNSVKKAISDTKSIGRPPPKGFPGTVLVRFDVQVPTELGIE